MSKRFFQLAFIGLSASLLPLMGCGGGVECGPGTIEQDGECVLESDLECPAGQIGVGGSCVDPASLCDSPATYDADSGTCVFDPGPDLTCGPNTVEDDGACVVENPVNCGSGTQLDPNTNDCVVTSAVCGGGTAYDNATDTCLPTADVCQEGTTFDAELGLCLQAVNCQSGDVVVDGLCLRPAQALAADADFDAAGENSNPFLDGEPHSVTVGSSFTGTIIAPTDVDGDGELDQHYDFFAFEAEAGDWFEISVQSAGIPAPHFRVWLDDGEDLIDYRQSLVFTGAQKARQITVPVDATVIVQVGPEGAFLGGPVMGGDSWSYVGAVEQVTPPTPTTHDLEGGPIEGDLGLLTNNFFALDGLEPGIFIDFMVNRFPRDADMVIQVWETPTVFLGEWDDDFSIDPDTEELFIVFDWYIGFGANDLGYEVAIEPQADLDPGETVEMTFQASQYDILEIRQANADSEEVIIQITWPDGSVTGEALGTGVNDVLRFIGVEGGTYTISARNAGTEPIANFIFMPTFTSPTPVDVGVTYSGSSDERDLAPQAWFLIEAEETGALGLTYTKLSGSGFARSFLYSGDGEQVFRDSLRISSNGSSRTNSLEVEEGQTYILRIGDDLNTTVTTWQFDFEIELFEVVNLAEETFVYGSLLDRVRISQDSGASQQVVVTDSSGEVAWTGNVGATANTVLPILDPDTYTATIIGPSTADAITLTIEHAEFLADGNFFLNARSDVVFSQDNPDNASVYVGLVDGEGEVLANSLLTSSGTLTRTLDEGNYEWEVRSFATSSVDVTVDTFELGVVAQDDFVIGSSLDRVRVAHDAGSSRTIVIENDLGEEVWTGSVFSSSILPVSVEFEPGNYTAFAIGRIGAAEFDITVTVADLVAEEDFTLSATSDVSIQQSNADSALTYIAVYDSLGEVYLNSTLSSAGTSTLTLPAGSYTVELRSFNTTDADITLETSELTVLASGTVNAATGDVFKITQTNDDSATVQVFVTNSSDQIVASGSLSPTGIVRAFNLEAGEYTYELVGPDTVQGVVAESSLVSPTVQSNLNTSFTVSGLESNTGPQNYYLIEVSEATELQVTVTNDTTETTGVGGIRSFVYDEDGSQFFRASSEAYGSFNQTVVSVISLEAGVRYLLRIGNDWASFDNPYTGEVELETL